MSRIPRTALAGIAAATLLFLPTETTSAGASFTGASAVPDFASATAAQLPSLDGGTGQRDADGGAEVSWPTPALPQDVPPAYRVERSVGGTTTTLTVEPSAHDDITGFADDLTLPTFFLGKTVTAISTGTSHSCAVADGEAYCWGLGAEGQLGDGQNTGSAVPVAVDTSGVLAGKTITAISTGSFLSCAVADGGAYCWGLGELGDGQTTTSAVPVAVDTSGVLAGKTVTAITVGFVRQCLIADGGAYCWGMNADGRLGTGDTVYSAVPVAVDTSGVLAGKTVTAISAAPNHACVIADGGAYCWGSSLHGMLGTGQTGVSYVPVAVDTSGVLAGKTVTAITTASHHTCAVADGGAYCWGSGGFGRLGNGDTATSAVPVAVDTSGALGGKAVTAIGASETTSCAVADGGAYCWGNGGSGRLGNGDTATSAVPVAVDTSGALGGKAVTAIASLDAHVCAIADGGAYCWGNGGSGRLGNNETTPSPVPVAVDTSGALSPDACPGDWTLIADERCAPGPSVPVTYEVDYILRGWQPEQSLIIPAPLSP
ncbi:RCC1 domain-containing protein [Bogoriella caseilytica]|uniref:Alpha-tubulin suppressor-like RCC1 family protein n=1 Tax=Bogoriella caseilytica TaxID=56055 RepID=A0A3N2BE98_9MICO|nr:hypothetical protein [Bogoriella caseilytica]ROR73562.1 alpha-tubulin suppressor-like RCC1 family protein [Bogoriella caseilytica]